MVGADRHGRTRPVRASASMALHGFQAGFDPMPVPGVLLRPRLHAQGLGQVASTRRLLSGWISQAIDRASALTRARPAASAGSSGGCGSGLFQILDDGQRLRQHALPSSSCNTGTSAAGFMALNSAANCCPPPFEQDAPGCNRRRALSARGRCARGKLAELRK
jgi:hypothetical protein